MRIATRGGPSRLVAAALASLGTAISPAADRDGAHPRSAPPAEIEKSRPESLLVRNATIWTQGSAGRLEGADLLVRRGKIERVGRGLASPPGAMVVDATGKHVTPGLIDCHSHTAIRGGVNEGSNNVTSEVRVADVIDPTDERIYLELAGGLTAAHLLHGSANSIGGQDAVIKLRWGARAEDLLIPDAFAGIKFALGENPKRSNFDPPPGTERRSPTTRMGVMASIRQAFLAARDYQRTWDDYRKLSRREQQHRAPPRRDLQLEAIAEILRGDRKIHSHCYRQDEILALIRVAEEFGVQIATFQHVLEGYKVADEIAAHGAGASTFSDWWAYKLEAYDATPYNGALMRERGVLVSFNSDSDELARRLNLEAAKAVKYGGVDPEAALDFVTRNPAIQLGIAHRTGSLDAGKDADFVIWSGDPLSTYSIPEQTWVEGVREFDLEWDGIHRDAVERERTERLAVLRKTVSPGSKPPRKDRTGAPEARPLFYLDRQAATEGAVSILHATVHTVSGDVIPDGTVSFRNGRIIEVGPGLQPPAGSTVVDGRGKHVYPGMIDAMTEVGLTEIGSVAGSVDAAEAGAINAHVNPAIAVNPDSELIPVTRANGITHVLTVPAGGLVPGSSALVRLDGWTWEDLVAATPVGLHVRWPSFRVTPPPPFLSDAPSIEDQKKKRKEDLERIRRAFDDARAYGLAKAAQGSGGAAFDVDPVLEALLPVIEGKVPAILHADEARQIGSALDWAEEEGIRVILAGAGDVWRVADRLRERRIPVILTGVLSLPERHDEPYDEAYRVASKLHQAGVQFCIGGPGGGFSAANTRNLPYHAAMAAAFGLPRDEALKSVTLYPARVLGLDHDLGSVEPGKSASLIVTDGDPLEIRTRIWAAWIDGRPVDLEANRHDRLYRRHRDRPRTRSETAGRTSSTR